MPLAGQRIKALDFTEAKTAVSSSAQTNIGTSTSAGSPGVDVTIVAPTSGKLAVTVGGLMQNDVASGRASMEFEIYEGTSAAGTPIITAINTQYRVQFRGHSDVLSQAASRTRIVSGLTPGVTYFVRLVHQGNDGTSADILQRTLDVIPLPA